MTSLRSRMLLLAAVAGFAAAGCALLSKSAPIKPRYFSPERPGDAPSASRRLEPPVELRLGRVEGVANLEEMLVYRDSPREVGYYRLQRWTEAPEEYLKRRLARVLFEERGLREVVSGGGPTLDVKLTAFEEVRGARRVARVQVIAKLHDGRLVTWEETVTVELPVVVARGGDPADASVDAIGKALGAAVNRIADRVVLELAGRPGARVSR